MKKKTLLLMLLALVALAQLLVPISMIARREATLKHGVGYRFETRPVDPYDVFRGRYVALGFEQNEVAVTTTGDWRRGHRIYVTLETDENGFARLGQGLARRPGEGDYLKTKVLHVLPGGKRVRVDLPFDRYYMNENEAPAAEAAYLDAARQGARQAYAVVRVRQGMAVIENLFVEDMPVLDFLVARQSEAE